MCSSSRQVLPAVTSLPDAPTGGTGMRRRTLGLRSFAIAALLVLGTGLTVPVQQSAAAADSATDYCLGQCNDILPPGENGNATLADILANKALGTHPAHSDDQLGPYANLSDGYSTLTDAHHRQVLQRLLLRRAGRPGGLHREPALRRDHRARQGHRGAAHHRHHPLRHRVRRRVRRGGGPAVADGPVPARRPRRADLVRRRRRRQPGPGAEFWQRPRTPRPTCRRRSTGSPPAARAASRRWPTRSPTSTASTPTSPRRCPAGTSPASTTSPGTSTRSPTPGPSTTSSSPT